MNTIDTIRINGINYNIGGGSGTGLTDNIKSALDQLSQKVAYIDDDGQDYYDALHNALYPPASLSSISCVYTQSGTVYDTDSLDSLKTDLVVTAHWSNSTTTTVPSADYTLSGTLTEGTSTVTVAYGGKTTTFNVMVTHQGTSDMDGWTSGVPYTNLEVVQNEYSKQTSGEFLPYTGWDRTGYVPCDGASTIVFPPMALSDLEGQPTSNNFYTSEHTRINYFSLSRTESTTITVPSNAAYFVISGSRTAFNDCIANGITPYE